MAEKILRQREVTERTGLPRCSIYKEVRSGRFPQPVKIAPRASGWLESEVEQWLAERIATRGSSTHTA